MDSWLKKYWYNVTRTGVVEYLKPEQQEQISLVNKTGLIAGLLSALFIGIFYRPFVEVGMLYFSIYFTILCFFVLLLNHIKKYHFATFYLFSLFSLGIFYVASIFGYDSNMHFLYIINLFAIVMAFGASDKWHLVGAISIPIILLILLFSTNFSLLKPTYLSLNYVEFVRMSVAFACIIGAIFLAYMHVNLSEKGYRRLKTEINEKQKNAQLLQQSENKLKALIENTRDNIWSVDTQFRIITMNSAFQNICKNVFHVHLEEGDNVLQGFPQEMMNYWKGIYERAFAGESFKIEWAYYNTFINRQIYVETQVSPIFNQDKKIQGATLFGRDITKRRETEKLIKQKDELLQAINQNIKEGIFRSVLDKGGIYVNESYVKMFGFESVEEALQTSPDKFYVNESDRIELVNRLLNDNHVTNQEVLYRRKDGSSFWALVSAIVTKSENGELFFDGTIKDITELKTIQVQLEKAKEIAEQSAASKTQFLSAMSHEIRTPLNAIIGISRLLLDENPKPDQIENLNTLRFSAQNLLVLINDILDFNKIEAGKVVLENIDFNLQELLKNIKLGFQIAAEDNKNLLIVQVDEQIPEFIKGDPTRLSQILTNLVGNAIKFTQKGKVTIQLGLLEKTEKEVVILFSIIDTGIGIPQEKQHVIFEGFTQATAETTRKYGGTGLGLAITKRLLEMQNSQIELESSVGKGSKFSFILKFGIGQKREKNDAQPQNNLFKPFDKQRILLVEDNLANQLVAKRFLTKWGLTVSIAEDGEIALKMLQYEDFDLILMDIQMPNLNGYETTMAIRNMPNDKYQKLPIIALTASINSSVNGKITEAGMNEFILKPFEPEELYNKIAHYLTKSS